MPEYLAPRVYVEEVDTGSKPIEGVSTSTAGMVGVAERGPVDVPILITSYGEFGRWFGGRLGIEVFRNPSGAHCYLPHAVEGFFTNGGKRVYVTRVLDKTLAVNASAIVFDRGASTAATVLLRTAGEGTGTAATPPALYLLDKTVRPPGLAWFRIGDGSAADYVQLDGTTAAPADTFVPLDFPLSRSHASGVKAEQFGNLLDAPSYNAALKLVAATATPRGATTLVLAGTGGGAAADVAKLIATPNQLLEIGNPNQGEYRFALRAAATAGGTVTVTLDSGLVMSYANNAQVTPLKLTLPAPATAKSGTLGLDANAGDPLAFLTSLNGVFNTTNDLVVFESNDPVNREARRIGNLSALTLTAGAYEAYPRGTAVRKITLGDDDTRAAPAPILGAASMRVADVSGLARGMSVKVGPAANSETVLIQSVLPDPAPATSGTVAFTPAFVNAAHIAVSAVSPPGGALTAAAAAGASLVALDNRLGLSAGDVVRVGLAPDEEYLAVAGLPAAGGPVPDPGNVVLALPLARARPPGTPVRRQLRPSPVAALQPTVTVLTAAPGALNLVVTDGTGFAAADLVQLTTPTGQVTYHRLPAAGTALAPAMINSATPLERAHPAGSVAVPRSPLLDIQALDAGAWGDRLRVAIEDEPAGLVSGTTLATVTNSTGRNSPPALLDFVV